VAAAVVDLADATGRGLVLVEQGAGGGVEALPRTAGADVAGAARQVLEGLGQREELAEGVPAQVVLLDELLHVLGGRAAGAGLEEATAVHQRDDRQHLGRRAELEDREQVGVVVAQHVAGHRDGVLAAADALDRLVGWPRRGRRCVMSRPVGVVVGEVLLDQRDEVAVVGALVVEPEDRRGVGDAGAGDGELHPVADRGVLGLAGAPDVARLRRRAT
jgi:hypothetical protein